MRYKSKFIVAQKHSTNIKQFFILLVSEDEDNTEILITEFQN